LQNKCKANAFKNFAKELSGEWQATFSENRFTHFRGENFVTQKPINSLRVAYQNEFCFAVSW